MSLGPWQLLIILAIVLLLFGGRGKVSSLMGDFGKGLRSFKSGLKGPEDADEPVEADVIESAPETRKTPTRKAAKKRAAKKKATAKKTAKSAAPKKKVVKKAAPKKAAAKKKATKKAAAKK